MDAQTRRVLRRMKSHRRRAEWRAEARVIRMLESVIARLDANGTPEQWEKAFIDLLNIRSDAGQTASVAKIMSEQIQALADAFTRISVAVKSHDESSATERGDIKALMVQVRQLQRKQVAQLDDIERVLGMSQEERIKMRKVSGEDG